MKWGTIIIILAILGAFYYVIMLIKTGKGIDVLAWACIVAITIFIISYINFVKENQIG